MEAPPFWWRPPSWPSAALAPAAAAYGAVASRNLVRGKRVGLDVPVLCVGNFIVGGGGKTPTSMALAKAARDAGYNPGFVTRGYGRKTKTAMRVDPASHAVLDVGDEPLLLAGVAPTAVAADRAQSAAMLIAECGVDFLIMDDGFQSARLAVDYTLIAVDARRGLGNGRVIPAGPLRAPLAVQLGYVDGVVVIGEGPHRVPVVRRMARAGKPVFRAAIAPVEAERLSGMRVFAFAGIADPHKFYETLSGLGAKVVATHEFPDHHHFRKSDIDALLAAAWKDGLHIVTTRKDAVRLKTGGPSMAMFARECDILDVELVFGSRNDAARIVRQTVAAYRRRRFG